MELHGKQLIGAETSSDGNATFTATDPRTATPLAGTFHEATTDEVHRAMSLACLNVLQDHIYLKEKTTKIT